jgi:hypothetical protein
MELGSTEVQIFVSLVVVLGVAFVALVCDFLKGNNERLREKNVELVVRQEERERSTIQDPVTWLRDLATVLRHPRTGRLFPPETGAVAADEPVPVEREPADEPRREAPSTEPIAAPVPAVQPAWATAGEIEMAEQRAMSIRARRVAPELKVPAPEPDFAVDPDVPTRPVMSAEPPPLNAPACSVLETLEPEPAAAPNVPISVSPEPSEPAIALAMPEESSVKLPDGELPVEILAEEARQPEPAPLETPAEAVAADAAAPEIVQVKVLPIDAAHRFEAFTVEADDAPAPGNPAGPAEVEPAPEFEEVAVLSAAEGTPAVEPAPEPEASPVPEAAAEAAPQVPAIDELAIPPGLHSGEELSPVIESAAPFSGVVVAIGINDIEAVKARTPAPDLSASLSNLIDSMLRDRDSACRSAEDEFILLFPAESGTSAQRRLYQVSEKLWDYQLRSLGSHSVVFSWGGLEVQREPVAEAVASARERMVQTKRNRARLAPPLEFSSVRQMVVNG